MIVLPARNLAKSPGTAIIVAMHRVFASAALFLGVFRSIIALAPRFFQSFRAVRGPRPRPRLRPGCLRWCTDRCAGDWPCGRLSPVSDNVSHRHGTVSLTLR